MRAVGLQSLGPDKESYRWHYLIENNRDQDDYSKLLPVLAEAHRRRSSPEPEAAAAAFLHDVQHYSGLLVERGPDAYSFLHLTFQEYFAARALADMSDAADPRISAIHGYVDALRDALHAATTPEAKLAISDQILAVVSHSRGAQFCGPPLVAPKVSLDRPSRPRSHFTSQSGSSGF